MPLSVKALCLLISVLSLSACTISNDTIKLNYQNLPPRANAVPAPTKTTIFIAPVTDNHNANPALIIQKVDVYNHLTSGAYVADQPIAEIVQNAISHGLQSIGYNISMTSAAPYTLQATLNSILQDDRMGFGKGQLSLILNVSFTLSDKNGSLIWAQTLIGTGKTEASSWTHTEASVRASFNAALNDLIQQLQASTTFRTDMMP